MSVIRVKRKVESVKFKEGTVHVHIPEEKFCNGCRETKPSSAFDLRHVNRSYGRYIGLYSLCRSCKRDKTRQYRKDNLDHVREITRRSERKRRYRRYGLTEDEYIKLFSEQNNSCAICKSEEPSNSRGWHVDHNHTTGVVRGILCHHCNLLLGNARDNPQVLEEAIKYLGVYINKTQD